MMSTETALSTGQAQTTIADPTTLPAVSQDGGTFVTPVFTRPKVVTFSHLAQKLEKYISKANEKEAGGAGDCHLCSGGIHSYICTLDCTT